jgi:hypothetical protein
MVMVSKGSLILESICVAELTLQFYIHFQGQDVDLDDPDFWAKAVGLEAPPEDMDPDMKLIIDPYSDFLDAEKMEEEAKKREEEEAQERRDLARLEKMLR